MNTTGKRVLERLALIVLALVVWQLVVIWGVFSSNTLPSIPTFLNATLRIVVTPQYWDAIADTLSSWAVGLVIAGVIGIPLGLISGSTKFMRRLTTPTIDFLRTIPAIILVPLVVLLLGSTNDMKVVLIVFATTWVFLVQAAYGIQAVDPLARQTFQAYGIPWKERVRFLYLPSAAPYLATGLRVAAIIALLTAVGAEIIGSAPGIGYQIGVKSVNAQGGQSFVYLITAAVLGIIITVIFTRLERRLIRWHPSVREVAL